MTHNANVLERIITFDVMKTTCNKTEKLKHCIVKASFFKLYIGLWTDNNRKWNLFPSLQLNGEFQCEILLTIKHLLLSFISCFLFFLSFFHFFLFYYSFHTCTHTHTYIRTKCKYVYQHTFLQNIRYLY